MSQHIEDLCEDKARAGDGSFAIAYALLRLADAQKSVAHELRQLGIGDAASPMGAILHLTDHLTRSVDGVAAAIESLADDE